MAEAKADMNEFVNRNKNTIIITVAIFVLAVVFMYFWDRQQNRQLQLEIFETKTELLEERRPPTQNTTQNNSGGRIL